MRRDLSRLAHTHCKKTIKNDGLKSERLSGNNYITHLYMRN